MLRHEKYGHILDQAQHGKAQVINEGDAMNACKLQCNVHYIIMMPDNATIYDDAWQCNYIFFLFCFWNANAWWCMILKCATMRGFWDARELEYATTRVAWSTCIMQLIKSRSGMTNTEGLAPSEDLGSPRPSEYLCGSSGRSSLKWTVHTISCLKRKQT